MVRYWILFVFFTLLGGSLFSQSDAIKKKIEWKEPRTFKTFKQSKEMSSDRYLFFEEAHYPDRKSFLPYFSDLLSLQNPAKVHVTLHDLRFTSLSHSEYLNNEAKKYIKETIQVSSDVYLSGGHPKLSLKFVPVRKNPNNGRFEKLEEFTIKYNAINSKSVNAQPEVDISEESVLANGQWSKIRVEERGIYKITYSQLKKMGFENLSNINI